MVDQQVIQLDLEEHLLLLHHLIIQTILMVLQDRILHMLLATRLQSGSEIQLEMLQIQMTTITLRLIQILLQVEEYQEGERIVRLVQQL